METCGTLKEAMALVPQQMSMEEASATPLALLTAYQAMMLGSGEAISEIASGRTRAMRKRAVAWGRACWFMPAREVWGTSACNWRRFMALRTTTSLIYSILFSINKVFWPGHCDHVFES